MPPARTVVAAVLVASLALPLVAALRGGTPAPTSEPRSFVRSSFPAQALALSADADGDGFVTREEIADACARSVAGAEATFERDWRDKLAIYGMPEDSRTLDVERIFAATAAIVEGADADHDGRTTPAELKAYVERFPASRRPDMIQMALTLDRDVDMTVSREEVAAARNRVASEIERIKAIEDPGIREALLHPSKAEALATWKASTKRIADAAIVLWRDVAAGTGRASVGDLRAVQPDAPDTAPKAEASAAARP